MIRSALFRMALTAAAALVVGCASASGARGEPSSTAATAAANEPGPSPQSMGQGQGMGGQGMGGQGMGMMGGGMCPMQVQGTTVTATDVEGGVALDFKTTGDVAELRQRVRRMAVMHERHASGGMMKGGRSGGPGTEHGGMMMGGMRMPAATASVEDIEAGARLVLQPKDPSQLAALREHARMRAARMASGQCPMMSGSQGQ